ncbi:MAG: hypothetical protein ABSB01_14105, partial [Streptosporangiaceae bacterium]
MCLSRQAGARHGDGKLAATAWLPAPCGKGDDHSMTVTLDRNVEAFIGAPRQLFINGQWSNAASGRTFETPNPATGETLARVAEGEAED